MKRIYRHYLDWEDFECGMWTRASKQFEHEMINIAVLFTGDHEKYGEAMREVILKWPNTMEHNLTNTSINRLAFIGHCAVTMRIGVPEYITRKAWGLLTDKQRLDANNEASKALKIWIHSRTKKDNQLSLL